MLELFITGADNNSDKIFVTAGLTATMQCLGYSTGVYKPVEVDALALRTVRVHTEKLQLFVIEQQLAPKVLYSQ